MNKPVVAYEVIRFQATQWQIYSAVGARVPAHKFSHTCKAEADALVAMLNDAYEDGQRAQKLATEFPLLAAICG